MQEGKFSLDLVAYLNLPKAFQKYQEEQQRLQGGKLEVIVKYHGELEARESEVPFTGEYLSCGYAIAFLEVDRLGVFSELVEVDYIELPSKLWYTLDENRKEICVESLQVSRPGQEKKSNLYGTGVIVAIIDSGIDYAHLDFRNADGTTRILSLWDQTIDSKELNERQNTDIYKPPVGFLLGTEFSEEEINEALEKKTRSEQIKLLPSVDISGHGTHVAGIACGNGRASGGKYTGVAPRSLMLVVKLGEETGITFPKTTRLMEALEYVVRLAQNLQMPLAINVSFGNNEGPHTGGDLISAYINQIATTWKNNICVGTGNEGNLGRHKSGNLFGKEREKIELVIQNQVGAMQLHLWKNYVDIFSITVIAPDGTKNILENRENGLFVWEFFDCILVVNYGSTSPYQGLQEVFMQWLPKENQLQDGIWTFFLETEKILDGRYDFWLGTGATIGTKTRFLSPSLDTTLTMPASARRVISVGAYNGVTEEVAVFSGRGLTRNEQLKPDLVAPGVDVVSTAPNNSYTVKSGTSMATPFVTGAAALLMEWGIVNGNDTNLYGEKMKSNLQKGARLIGRNEKPNGQIGYGALCVSASLPT